MSETYDRAYATVMATVDRVFMEFGHDPAVDRANHHLTSWRDLPHATMIAYHVEQGFSDVNWQIIVRLAYDFEHAGRTHRQPPSITVQGRQSMLSLALALALWPIAHGELGETYRDKLTHAMRGDWTEDQG